MSRRYVLGIDVGTSTVKAALVKRDDLTVYDKHFEQTCAATLCHVAGGHEQSVTTILRCLDVVVNRFSKEDLEQVAGIGISGQMHGCVLWNDEQIRVAEQAIVVGRERACSSLVTCQDGRCSEAFLASLPHSNASTRISTGYGCATLFWLSIHQPDILQAFNRAGTVMDLIVWALCGGRGKVAMSCHNAASWGYFDRERGAWEEEILQKTKFSHLLPVVHPSPSIAGYLETRWHGIPAGTLVGVAMGDLQCSVRACQPKEGDAVLNIGSASQLAAIKPSSFSLDISLYPSLMEVPYFIGSSLLVAAALTGGNVVARLVKFLQEFLVSVGITDSQVTEEAIYASLTSSAASKMETPLKIDPVIFGERHNPAGRGVVSNITTDNLSLGDICSALCRGVAENIASMMPAEVLHALKVDRIVGGGSTLHRNRPLTDHVERVFHLHCGKKVPLVLGTSTDAPLGAAMAVIDLIQET